MRWWQANFPLEWKRHQSRACCRNHAPELSPGDYEQNELPLDSQLKSLPTDLAWNCCGNEPNFMQ